MYPRDYESAYFRKNKDIVPRIDEFYSEMRYKTRVVSFFYDKDEYKQEIKNLRESARYLSSRENLRIGIVDDKKLIKRLKLKYGVKWFDPISMSSVVLKRYDGEYLTYDITSEHEVNFHHWINKNSMKEVDELMGESYKIYELLRQPMFLTFVDFDNPKYSKQSHRAVDIVKQVAPKFSKYFGFMYVNNT